MVQAPDVTLAFCGNSGCLSRVRIAKQRLCNSRFSHSRPLGTIRTRHPSILVACIPPPSHTSDPKTTPEPSADRYVEISDDVHLPPDTKLVSLPTPLGIFTEQTIDGEVFVDEVEEDGNASNFGGLEVGDVIVAVSLPFGNELLPVPKTGGVDMIANHISSRDTNESLFHMAISKNHDIDDLRSRLEEDTDFLKADEALNLARKIHVLEYPVKKSNSEKSEDSFASPSKSLTEYGFDMDSVHSIVEEKTRE